MVLGRGQRDQGFRKQEQEEMRNRIKSAGLLMLAAGVAVGPAWAAGFFTNGTPRAGGTEFPQTIPLTGSETIPADTTLSGGRNPQSEAVTMTQIAGFGAQQQGLGRNLLIGGDAKTNLWQRGTSIASITTTKTYTADRWFAWSGASSDITVAQSTTAGDLAEGYSMAFKVSRTGSGTVPVCFGQVLAGRNAIQLAGQTAEFSFSAKPGAGFSAAGGLMTAYVTYGTGTDQASTDFAFGLNGGGGGSAGWTGQTNAVAKTVALPGTKGTRFVAVAAIPSTATEVGVALCWTGVGTPTNDYVSLMGLQLASNSSLAAYVNTAGEAAFGATGTIPASAFEHRLQGVETILQLAYTYSFSEAAAAVVQSPTGSALGTTTTCTVYIPFPVTMRTAPTYTNSLSATTFKVVSASQTAGAVLATPFSATLTANTPTGASINFTTTGMTAKDGCYLIGAGGGGGLLWSAEL